MCVACWGQGSWIYQNGSQNRRCWVLKSMVFVTFFDRFFVDFIFTFACWPGRPDKRRTHTEHTQSTHREQLSPRFPFLCQDRFLFMSKWGSENEVEKHVEKGSPNGPQKLLKIDKSVFWRGLKKRPQNGPSPGAGKVRFCSYFLHFSKVRGFKKVTFLGTILGPFGRQNR